MLRSPVLVLPLLVGLSLGAQESRPEADLAPKIEVLARAFVARPEVVGLAIGVLHEGRTVTWFHGTRRADTKDPIDATTLFEIGSISKAFTGSLLALLAHRKELGLEDTLEAHLPKGTLRDPDLRRIRLVDLATHASGLPRLPTNLKPSNPRDPYAGYDEAALFDFLGAFEAIRAPGALYEYSNLGAGLLGTLLARTAGCGYDELLRTRICEPLGMRDTAVAPSPALLARTATGHDARGRPTPAWTFQALAGAGGIRSTVSDMLTFLRANVTCENVELRAAFERARTSAWQKGDFEMGLGWHFEKVAGRRVVWHNGGTGGFRSFCAFVPETGNAVVVLTNTNSSVDALGMKLVALQHARSTASRPADTTRRGGL